MYNRFIIKCYKKFKYSRKSCILPSLTGFEYKTTLHSALTTSYRHFLDKYVYKD